MIPEQMSGSQTWSLAAVLHSLVLDIGYRYIQFMKIIKKFYGSCAYLFKSTQNTFNDDTFNLR